MVSSQLDKQPAGRHRQLRDSGRNCGPVTTILLAGRLGTADMIFLGNGTVLVGTQGAASGIVIAQGTTAQAVGMTAGNGDPLSEFDGNPVPGGAYVINRGSSEVDFVVAGKRHSLGPEDEAVHTRRGRQD